MKIKYDPNILTQSNVNMLEPFRAKSQMEISGYEINGVEFNVPSEDVNQTDAETLMDFAEVKDYEIWLEIPNQYIDDFIPDTISWSSYEVEDASGNISIVDRKYSDMTLFREGTTKQIRYLQDITSSIEKNDFKELKKQAKIKVFNKKELKDVLNDPNDEYYVEDII